jgi:hypothetical protein
MRVQRSDFGSNLPAPKIESQQETIWEAGLAGDCADLGIGRGEALDAARMPRQRGVEQEFSDAAGKPPPAGAGVMQRAAISPMPSGSSRSAPGRWKRSPGLVLLRQVAPEEMALVAILVVDTQRPINGPITV